MTATYKIKEIFSTLQGEGFHTGYESIFIRFVGCNLWSGYEKDRDNNKTCGKWCDTNFINGKLYTIEGILLELSNLPKPKLIVFTGGEPYLQLTQTLIDAINTFYGNDIKICVETNGTIDKVYSNLWVTCSPKSFTNIKIQICDEVKIVLPQIINMRIPKASYYFVQPRDGLQNLSECLTFINNNTEYKLSIQTHKILGIQ